MSRSFLLISLAVSAFCVVSIKAFVPAVRVTSSTRGAVGTRTIQPSPYISSSSTTNLNLFPFSRSKNSDNEDNGAGNATKASKKAAKRWESDDQYDDEEEEGESSVAASRGPKVDDLVQLVSLRMRRLSFLSWWAQVILTVVSGVTLLFTRNVLSIETAASKAASLLPNYYFLAGSSIGLSMGSIFWTWATRRLSRRLLRKPTTRVQAANMLRKSITVGTCLNLMGMAFALFGAEQIVGGLAIKVLTQSTTAPTLYQSASAAMLLQPLDILVVQANTNTLFSHFCSIVAYLYLGRSIGQLDPPSVEGDERLRA